MILQCLDQVLSRPLGHVFCAGRRTPPPLLSQVVHFPRLGLPLAGQYELEIEQDGAPVVVTALPGSAVLAPPNCWDRPTWRLPVRVLTVLFGRKQIGLSLAETGPGGEGTLQAQKMSLAQPLGSGAEKMLAALVELGEQAAPSPALPDLTRALLWGLREQASAQERPRQPKGKGLLEEVCVWLQQNYQRPVGREEAAARFGVTPNHLSRLFQEHGSMKFCDYLTYVRIDRAKFLLKTYAMRVEEIAWQCGYRDVAYFCRIFRRITHRTPGEYRGMISRVKG